MKLSNNVLLEIFQHQNSQAVLSGKAVVVHHYAYSSKPNGPCSVVFPHFRTPEHFDTASQAYAICAAFNSNKR